MGCLLAAPAATGIGLWILSEDPPQPIFPATLGLHRRGICPTGRIWQEMETGLALRKKWGTRSTPKRAIASHMGTRHTLYNSVTERDGRASAKTAPCPAVLRCPAAIRVAETVHELHSAPICYAETWSAHGRPRRHLRQSEACTSRIGAFPLQGAPIGRYGRAYRPA